jgi:UDP-glucose-4-epimerase GalE
LPITEDTPQRPVNAYGESKLMCERLIRWFAECHGMQYVILRYFNAAGADPEGEIGECHDPEPHLIPIVLRAVSEGRPVTIYGTDYPTPDGTAIRDYVHVSDLARAHVLAAEHLLRGGESLAVNLGTGKGHSVLEVIRTAEKVVGHRAEIEIASRRLGDPAMLVASNASAKQTLGWAPEYPELRTMMEHALRFSELRW